MLISHFEARDNHGSIYQYSFLFVKIISCDYNLVGLIFLFPSNCPWSVKYVLRKMKVDCSFFSFVRGRTSTVPVTLAKIIRVRKADNSRHIFSSVIDLVWSRTNKQSIFCFSFNDWIERFFARIIYLWLNPPSPIYNLNKFSLQLYHTY